MTLYRCVVVLVLAHVGVQGCNATLPLDNDHGTLSDAGTFDGDATPSYQPTQPIDADPQVDDGAVVATSSDATVPKICNPQDPRFCEVATAAEGVPCPTTFEQAKLAFTCANVPTGSHYLAGGCGSYLLASTSTSRHSTQCWYDPGTHALIGSHGYDDCGAFCGGVNHVYWGIDLNPCGITPDTEQGWCYADAGVDAEAGSDARSDASSDASSDAADSGAVLR